MSTVSFIVEIIVQCYHARVVNKIQNIPCPQKKKKKKKIMRVTLCVIFGIIVIPMIYLIINPK